MFAQTTAQSLLPRQYVSGWDDLGPPRCSSSPAAPGRTDIVKASTASSDMVCSTLRSSTHSKRQGFSSRIGAESTTLSGHTAVLEVGHRHQRQWHGCRQKLCLHMRRRWCYTSPRSGPIRWGRSRGSRIRRYQYTAIDDATRIRALRIYEKHTQKNAIQFLDYVIQKFPFRIHTVRTDRGHEWQAKFHWHVEDQGIRHVYIKPRSPQLNGKVERSHRTDGEEFYQLLTYTDDVDLARKLVDWEDFYNTNRPHGAHKGRTPYEALRSMLGKT